jgi:hypothetical protein
MSTRASALPGPDASESVNQPTDQTASPTAICSSRKGPPPHRYVRFGPKCSQLASRAHNNGPGQPDYMPNWCAPILLRVEHWLVSAAKSRDEGTSRIILTVGRQELRVPFRDSHGPTIASSSTGCKRWDSKYACLHARCCHGNSELAATGVAAGTYMKKPAHSSSTSTCFICRYSTYTAPLRTLDSPVPSASCH